MIIWAVLGILACGIVIGVVGAQFYYRNKSLPVECDKCGFFRYSIEKGKYEQKQSKENK